VSLPQVARQYARALYAVARETAELPVVENDMTQLDEIFERLPEVAAWCRGRHRTETGPALVREAFLPFVGILTGRTLTAAAERDRLSVIPWLSEAFRREAEAAGGRTNVRLESAQQPETSLVESIRLYVAERTGRRVSVEVTVLPELVAGFRFSWNDRMVDRSVRGRLGALRARLVSEAES
jgi:F-type H+-transporting ATPase subunit delta